MKKIIPYGKQFIDKNDIREVINTLKSNFITQGPAISIFEEKICKAFGCKYSVVFNSGTSALHGAYFVLGLKKDDEFITTPNTFVATSNAGLYLNAKPIFVDIEKDTGNIDANKIEKNITKKTKLIVPVHYGGHPVDLEKIYKIAKNYNLFIVEDACHAIGAKYKKEKIGSCKYSDMTIVSFHPVKHITTGEGGAVLTNNKEYYEKLLLFRNHGITKNHNQFSTFNSQQWYYEMQLLGYNFRLTDIQASLGISQLKKLNRFLNIRRKIAKIYNTAFYGNDYFEIISEKEYAYSSYHLYSILLNNIDECKKEKIFLKMRESGLLVQVHYIPVYFHPYYQNLGYKKGICPTAECFYVREMSIPIYPSLTDNDINYVIETIFKILKKYR